MAADKPHPLLRAEQIRQLPERRNVHQFNPAALRHVRSLSEAVGLEQLGLHLVRVEPGKQTTQHHFHHCTEEFLYVLAGQGVAWIGEESYPVGAGDFMGFTAPSLPHSMANPGPEDLVYLMGGTRSAFDICDYPRIRRRMFLRGETREAVEWDALTPVHPGGEGEDD